LQTRRLLADIKRVVDILNSDIADEEGQAGIFDPARPEYPILARAMAARRDNLKSTMATLQRRIPDLPALGAEGHLPSANALAFND
jgi:hypothetical protein